MNVYNVGVRYPDPVEAMVTLYARSEEDAINTVKAKFMEAYGDVTIIGIEQIGTAEGEPEDLSPDRSIQ